MNETTTTRTIPKEVWDQLEELKYKSNNKEPRPKGPARHVALALFASIMFGGVLCLALLGVH